MRFLFILLLLTFSTAFAGDMKTVNVDSLLQEIRAHSGKTLVVFWAPWCPHCVRELKLIRDNPQFVQAKGLKVVGLTKKADKNRAIALVEKEKMPFIFFLADEDVYRTYQKIDAVPLTMIFDSSGKVLDYEYGKQNLEDLELMLETAD
jgi:thiol-disulfide isomerase/thioredoxin